MYMKINNEIKFLLGRYYSAENSAEELKALKDNLQDFTSEEFAYDKTILNFSKYEAESDTISDDFETKLFAKISDLDKPQKNKKIIGKLGIIWNDSRKYFSIAAALLIMSGVSIWLSRGFDSSTAGIVITNQNVNENRELAITETQKAFRLISANMAVAGKQLEKLEFANKGFEKFGILHNITIKFN